MRRRSGARLMRWDGLKGECFLLRDGTEAIPRLILTALCSCAMLSSCETSPSGCLLINARQRDAKVLQLLTAYLPTYRARLLPV